MKIKRIFGCGKRTVYAVLFEPSDEIADITFDPDIEDAEEKDEFEKATDRWADPEYLRAFFKKYTKDLKAFDSSMNVGDAVRAVLKESENLHDVFDTIISNNDSVALVKLFKPLDNREVDIPPYELQKLKATGGSRKSLLRIYAIKYQHSFVITGGAIKLTPKMQGRPHLQNELYKLGRVREFLEKNGSVGLLGYIDIEIV